MEKKADTIVDGFRPQVDEDRERHQVELIQARIGSVGLSERPQHPTVDNSPFFDLEQVDGKLEVTYDYFIGLSEMEGGRYI